MGAKGLVRGWVRVAIGVPLLVLVSCGGPAVCGPLDEGCQRAAEEIERARMGEVAAVRQVPCVERPRALSCFVFTLADGEEVSAEVYRDRVDVGR